MLLNSIQLIKSCGTRTNPATVTRSIGLPADGQLSSYEAGALPVIENYVNNVVNGPSKLYYLNNLWCSGSYKNGKKDGEWQFYLNSGRLAKTTIYQDGRKIKVIWNTDQ